MNRNCDILKYILQYCNELSDAIELFGDDYQVFASNSHYRNDVSMCLMQIGELAKRLSAEFKEQTSNQVPWKQIKGMRNLFAHVYPTMSIVEIFKTAHDDIPQLKAFCERELEHMELLNADGKALDFADEDELER